VLIENVGEDVTFVNHQRDERHDMTSAEARVKSIPPFLPHCTLTAGKVSRPAKVLQELVDCGMLGQAVRHRELMHDGRIEGDHNGVSRRPDIQVEGVGKVVLLLYEVEQSLRGGVLGLLAQDDIHGA